MNGIKDLKNLAILSLSFNKLTQLTESDFVKLTNLKWLYLNNNLIKDLTVQTFLPTTMTLTRLYVDNLTSYENINSTLPKLLIMELSTKNWNCTYMKNVASILNDQNIYLNIYSTNYKQNSEAPECDESVKKINKIQLPFRILIRM